MNGTIGLSCRRAGKFLQFLCEHSIGSERPMRSSVGIRLFAFFFILLILVHSCPLDASVTDDSYQLLFLSYFSGEK